MHAVDVEGKQSGIEEDLVALLGEYCPISVTYAGGVRSIDVIESWECNNVLMIDLLTMQLTFCRFIFVGSRTCRADW